MPLAFYVILSLLHFVRVLLLFVFRVVSEYRDTLWDDCNSTSAKTIR